MRRTLQKAAATRRAFQVSGVWDVGTKLRCYVYTPRRLRVRSDESSGC